MAEVTSAETSTGMSSVQDIEEAVRRLSADELATFRAWFAEFGADIGVVLTPGVCGGEARLAGTRIPVWMLENARREGLSEADVLEMYPWLTTAQVRLAWSYADEHQDEMDTAIRDSQGD
jgi:uncharacterized protein (DUF433 family)